MLTEPIKPKKSLGQNFLINPGITQRICEASQIQPTEIILEIGPGKGALTHELSRRARHVIAIEKDKKLAEILTHDFRNSNVRVVACDILRYPFDQIPPKTKIVANLPYNIATPILTKIIEHRSTFSEVFATVQLEYGQRIAAGPHTKNYGAFSCFVQFYADTKILFKIKNTAFRPVPKVQSCFLKLALLKKPRFRVNNEDTLWKVIHACFGQRRKTIQNALTTLQDKGAIIKTLQSLDINPKLRAENLTLEDFVRITNIMGE